MTTVDLGNEAAIELAGNGLIKGIGAQQPYDLGTAVATATILSLVGHQLPPWIALPGLAVTQGNVVEAYQVVWHSPEPPDLIKARGGRGAY
jgi:ribose transport system substrate-binding protein